MTDSKTSEILAAKVVEKASLNKSRAKQKLMSEIKIHKSMKNEHVVDFKTYFEDSEYVYILLELCPNLTLNDMVKRRKRLTDFEARYYLAQVVNATKYMHSEKVIHRDLKLGNLFLNEKMQIRVGDFGLATRVIFDGEKKRTICGTPNYIAPEVLSSRTGHSFEVDIWSIGVILYTLLVGRPPFETSNVKSTYKRIRMNQYTFPDHVEISEAGKDLIQKLLKTEPKERLSLNQILAHSFFAEGVPTSMPSSTVACPPSSKIVEQFSSPNFVHTMRQPLKVSNNWVDEKKSGEKGDRAT